MTNRRECRLVTSTPVLNVWLLVYCDLFFYRCFDQSEAQMRTYQAKGCKWASAWQNAAGVPSFYPVHSFFLLTLSSIWNRVLVVQGRPTFSCASEGRKPRVCQALCSSAKASVYSWPLVRVRHRGDPGSDVAKFFPKYKHGKEDDILRLILGCTGQFWSSRWRNCGYLASIIVSLCAKLNYWALCGLF